MTRVGSLLAILIAPPATALAQDPSPPRASFWATGGSVGIPGYGMEPGFEVLTLGVHTTHIVPGSAGGDFSIATIPRLVVEGIVAFGVRAGFAVAARMAEDAYLLPSAGVTLLGGVASGGSEFGIVWLPAAQR